MNNIVSWINGWTSNGAFSILVFIPLAIVLFFASVKMVYHAEVIISKTKFGGAFVGGVLMATTTSIPELIADIGQSSVGNPGSGSASDIGSNAFSMLLIAVAAIIFYKQAFMSKFDKYTSITMILSALGALVMGVLMLVNKDIVLGTKGKFAIGIIPLGFLLFYVGTLFVQYKLGSHDDVPVNKGKPTDTVGKSLKMFAIYSLVIIALALAVSWTASSMIQGFGWDEDGVGGILLAITTSLPEISAFFLLVKRHQPIAGAATLIGSHFFNMAITFFGDMAYRDDASFNNHAVGQNWIIAIITAVGMGLLAFQVLMGKKGVKSKLFHLTIPTLATLAYVIGWVLEFTNVIT